MLGQIRNDHFILQDVSGRHKSVIDIGDFRELTGFRLSPDLKKMLLTGFLKVPSSPKKARRLSSYFDVSLVLVDLRNKETEVVFQGNAFQVNWLANCEGLVFHNGQSICTLDLKTKEITKHLKIGNINHIPTHISSSPDSSLISFKKAHNSRPAFGLYDLKNGNGDNLNIPCYSYSWIDSEHILLTYSNGTKILDLYTGKSENFIKEMFHFPLDMAKFYKERIYFVAEFCKKEENRDYFALMSMTLSKEDVQQHAVYSGAWIQDYFFVNEEKTIALQIVSKDEQDNNVYRYDYIGQYKDQIPNDFFPVSDNYQ